MLRYKIFNNINRLYFFKSISIILKDFAKGFIIYNSKD